MTLMFTVSVLVAACGDDSDPGPAPVCAAGASNPCTCSDGRAGTQICSADGSGYGACSCGSIPDAGCPQENGAVACNRVVGSWCARVVMCCDASTTPCADWTIDEASCRAFYVSDGLDCSSPMITSTSACTTAVNACVGDIPLVACSDIVAGTANLPASCSMF